MNKTQTIKEIEKHYRTNFSTLVKIFTRFTGNKARAEDVIQEGYTRSIQYWQGYPESNIPSEVNRWFRRIFNNCNHDMMKEEMHHGMSKHGEEEPIVNCSGFTSVMLDQVKKVINDKGPIFSEALNLSTICQWHPADVAKHTGLTENHIRQLLFRLRKELKDKFKWDK